MAGSTVICLSQFSNCSERVYDWDSSIKQVSFEWTTLLMLNVWKSNQIEYKTFGNDEQTLV